MQCGALILCFAAPAPVIDDSYHVCRPSIDFFLVLFCRRTRESCCGGAAFLFFHQAGFKSCSVFSQIASGGLGSRAARLQIKFRPRRRRFDAAESERIIWLLPCRRIVCFFDPVSGEMFLLRREKKKKSKGNTARGVLSLFSNFVFEACFGEKIKLFFLRSTPRCYGVEVLFPRL
jgi:hypothetical protein